MSAKVFSTAVCLDSNIFVCLMSPDESNDVIEDFFNILNRRGCSFYAPSLMQFEIAQTFGKKERARLMTSDSVDDAVKQLCALPILLEWNESLLEKALDIYRQGFKSLYDASFLAVAMKRNIPLVTEDQEILKKGGKIYPHVYTMNEYHKQI